MPMLDNPRHEKFCHLVANGANARNAYVQAGYESTPSAFANASRLMATGPVALRINELRGISENNAVITRLEVLKILSEMAIEFPSDNPTRDSRMKAIMLMMKMCGWDSPTKVELGPSTELVELLKKLRGGEVEKLQDRVSDAPSAEGI